MGNEGLWPGWRTAREPICLGAEETYRRAVAWLDGHGAIADWGGGTGYAARFVTQSAYAVVDNSLHGPDEDLVTWERPAPCVLIRHVLEHAWEWETILGHAIEAFERRFVLVVHTPLGEETRLLRMEGGYWGAGPGMEVPVLELARPVLEALVAPWLVRVETVGAETLWYCEKPERTADGEADAD